jgi:hypothetical protein
MSGEQPSVYLSPHYGFDSGCEVLLSSAYRTSIN